MAHEAVRRQVAIGLDLASPQNAGTLGILRRVPHLLLGHEPLSERALIIPCSARMPTEANTCDCHI